MPKWHQVNDFDLNGNPCIGPIISVNCPVLCVQSPVDCPSNKYSAKDCSLGYELCNDGNCHPKDPNMNRACAGEDIQNMCSHHTCKSIGMVDMPNYHVNTWEIWCLDQYNVSHNVTECNTGGTNTNATDPCLLKMDYMDHSFHPPMLVLNWDEPAFIVCYCMWIVLAVLNVIWYGVKKSLEAPFKTVLTGQEKSFQHGYQDNWFGSAIYALVIVVSIYWQVAFFLICLDYYGYIEHHVNNHEPLIAVFHISSAWYCFLKAKQVSVRNWYRLRTDFTKCTYVNYWFIDEPTVCIDHPSKLTEFSKKLSTWWQNISGIRGISKTVAIIENSEGRYFDFRCRRHTYVKAEKLFKVHEEVMPSTNRGFLQMTQGLSLEEASQKNKLLGPNLIRVDVPNFFVSCWREFWSYFYIYRFSIIWILLYWSYWKVGVVFLGIFFLSGFIKVVITRLSKLRIKSMSEKKSDVDILRDGKWITLTSDVLVPGDVVRIDSGSVIQCDCVLVSGFATMNESMLTGESMPVQKFQLSDDGEFSKMEGGKKSTLFSGTEVLQIEPASGEENVLVVVESIGANTEKGKLISKVLSDSNIVFVFDQHLNFVFLVLAVWMAVIMTYVVLINDGKGSGVWLVMVATSAMVLSPILPSMLVIGEGIAASRLRKECIYCLDIHRIPYAGKVRIQCFDKTGTLTKSGLEFYGIQPINQAECKTLIRESKALPDLLHTAVGSAHTITKLGNAFVGNPVDVAMFEIAGWDLNSNVITDGQRTLTIIKKFEFDHARMSMSVAVQDMKSKEIHIFVKGSFEKVQQLSDPASVPKDFDHMTRQFVMDGCYTLGIAHRSLGIVPPETVQILSRDEFENGVSYIGLLLFRNNLKKDTKNTIQQLKDGNVRPLMITGDNALTGIYIAKKCGMIEKGSIVILGEVPANLPKIVEGNDDSKKERKASMKTPEVVVWKNAETGKVIDMTEYAIETQESFQSQNGYLEVLNVGNENPTELALTGKAFNILCQNDEMRKYLLKCRVFARMNPSDKVRCVQLHMEKEITAMCGDGGNDCGALRVAHVGLAMSNAEASIVSSFSTKNVSPLAMVTLLRQGRAALATSFSAYKFLLIYGETIIMAKFVYQYFNVELYEYVWILCDAFFITVLGYTLTLSNPRDKLSPRRPTVMLFGPETLISTMGIIVINGIFMMCSMVLLYQQPWFVCQEFDSRMIDITKWWLLADNFEGETLGIVLFYQCFVAAAIGNFGSYFREAWWKNYPFVFFFLLAFTTLSCVLLLDPNPLGCWLRFNCGNPENLRQYFNTTNTYSWSGVKYNSPIGHNIYPKEFRWKLLLFCLGNSAAVVIFQKVFILGPVREWVRKKWPMKKRQLVGKKWLIKKKQFSV